MLKKLLAVVFTAMLMIGTAWAGDMIYVYDGDDGKWKDAWDEGDDVADPEDAATFTGGADGHFIGSNKEGGEPAELDSAGITLSDNGKTLHIGSNEAGDAAGNAVNVTADAVTITDGTIKVYEGSTLTSEGALTLTASASTLANEGNVVLNDEIITTGKIINSGTLTLSDGANADDLASVLTNGAETDIGTINIGDGSAMTAFVVSGATAGTVSVAKQTNAATNAITVGGADVELNGGTISGAITANSVTFATGAGADKTTYTVTSGSLTEGYSIASAPKFSLPMLPTLLKVPPRL